MKANSAPVKLSATSDSGLPVQFYVTHRRLVELRRIQFNVAMKLLRSADWQLGCRFAQSGENAGILRDARPKTLRRTLEMAKQRTVDALTLGKRGVQI